MLIVYVLFTEPNLRWNDTCYAIDLSMILGINRRKMLSKLTSVSRCPMGKDQ